MILCLLLLVVAVGSAIAMVVSSKWTSGSIQTESHQQQQTIQEDPQTQSPLKQRVKNLLHDAMLINHYVDKAISKSPPHRQKSTLSLDSCHDTDDSSSHDHEEDVLISSRLDEMDRRVRITIPDIHHRHVPLGGKRPWYSRELLHQHYKASMDMRDEIKANDSQNWATHVHFPRTLCLRSPCRIETSILYSLQWREVYQPWRVTPSMIKENSLGYVYANGRSRDGHGLVYYRPGIVDRYQDEVSYFRCIFHAIEAAIAETGTFVAVVDAANFHWHKAPNIRYWVRQTITMLKDHYPHRLGGIYVYNMSSMTEMVMQLIRPLLPARVRDLTHIVKSRHDLVGSLGNALTEDDNFVFHTESYYEPNIFHWSDEEARQYLQFMDKPT